MRILGLVTTVIALTAAVGCGDRQNRWEVSGEVRVGGKPVEDGVINFAPLDGQGTGEGAQIVNGKYVIPQDKGLNPGKAIAGIKKMLLERSG